MKRGVASYKITGMQRDMSNAVLGQSGENRIKTVAYENMNMRVNALEEGEQFALVNERGTKLVTDMGKVINIKGIPIGQSILDNTLVLFTTEIGLECDIDITSDEIQQVINADDLYFNIDFDTKDRIYTFGIDNNSDSVDGRLLYEGYLNFMYNYPISAISFHENEDIQKVYWTDGINQPRVVNIAAEDTTVSLWNDDKFDFVRELKLHESVTITKNNDTTGMFSPGTIQYCMAYFDKYGQETGLFYVSPIYYITYDDRGTPADETVNNSFSITINNVDTTFDYVRIYSIYRASENGQASCSIVADLSIDPYSESYTTCHSPYSIYVADTRLVYITMVELGDTMIPLNDVNNSGSGSLCVIIENQSTGVIKYLFRTSVYGGLSKLIVKNKLELYPSGYDDVMVEYNRFTKNITVYYASRGRNVYDYFDAKMKGNPTLSFTDNGTTTSVADPYEVIYLNNMESITAGTMEQKDNTLFLGNFSLNKKRLYDMPVIIPGIADSNMTIGQVFTNQIADEADYNSSFRFRNDVKHLDKWLSTGYYNYDFQLNKNEFEIKTFKSREWYRFGLQFQHKTGKWSEPLWLGDKYNNLHPDCEYVNPDSQVGLITAELDMGKLISHSTTSPHDIIDTLVNNGFVKVRPVAVYPEPYERESICQGYLCPTVYNYYDRYKGYCYAQSSWFARPVITLEKAYNEDKKRYTDYIQEDNTYPANHMYANPVNCHKKLASGSPMEYRHNYPIPTHLSYSSEIQCIADSKKPYIENENAEIFASEYKNRFAVDCSIVTLHTPDYEDIYNNSLENCKLRIIGMVPLTSFSGDINAIMETAGHTFYDEHWNISIDPEWEQRNGKFKPGEFNRRKALVENLSINGANIMASGPYYLDLFYSENAEKQNDNIGLWMTSQPSQTSQNNLGGWQKAGNMSQIRPNYNYIKPLDQKAFIIYPWHRSNSFINQQSGEKWFAKPQSKKLSNLRYSYNTFYFDNDWQPERQLQDCQLFDSKEDIITKIKAPVNGKIENVVYKGNVDSIIATDVEHRYSITMQGSDYTSDEANSGVLKYTSIVRHNNDQGYFSYTGWYNNEYVDKHLYSSDPIRMQYKSTPHVVLSLKGLENKSAGNNVIDTINILPYFGYGGWDDVAKNSNTGFYGYSPIANYIYTNEKLFWDDKVKFVKQEGITNSVIGNMGDIRIDHSANPDPNLEGKIYGFLWLGELYRDNIKNRFGGTTAEAFETNKWVVCGEPVDLGYNTIVKWTGGDTYYQRYDNLKTYPASMEDVNSVVDIVSFMCETRVNIDGRTDRNRGLRDNTVMNPSVFNLMNKAYTQDNNFFPIVYTDPNKLTLDTFKNSVTWTLTKTAGELIDKWTMITLASVMDFDGDKGPINLLKKNNDVLYTFQDKAISIIRYNNNVALSTESGQPVELANSGKVDGKDYVSETVGCKNKWAAVNTQKGIYFIDDLNKEVYVVGGKEVVNLSEMKGFSTWFDDNVTGKTSWNPVLFNNFIVYYDKENHDVSFIYKDKSLAYNETFDQFSSFYDYGSTPYVADINGREIMVRNTDGTYNYKLWFAREGEYNTFFGNKKDFYTEFLVNDAADYSKIFDTVEFTADADNNGEHIPEYTFDRIDVRDTYQEGKEALSFKENRPSSLKKKFRTWRTPVPRCVHPNSKGIIKHDRMQDHWLFIKLSRNVTDDNYRHILYNTNVFYYM